MIGVNEDGELGLPYWLHRKRYGKVRKRLLYVMLGQSVASVRLKFGLGGETVEVPGACAVDKNQSQKWALPSSKLTITF